MTEAEKTQKEYDLQERIAIMQFDGGMSPDLAVHYAVKDMTAVKRDKLENGE